MAEADSSLERILRDHSALAQRLASSHEANPELARDLTQEILVAVWRAWPAFRQQCSERTYVARIAHNRIATHISRAVRQPVMVELSEELATAAPTPAELADTLGLTPNAVAIRGTRARDLLRVLLEV